MWLRPSVAVSVAKALAAALIYPLTWWELLDAAGAALKSQQQNKTNTQKTPKRTVWKQGEKKNNSRIEEPDAQLFQTGDEGQYHQS